MNRIEEDIRSGSFSGVYLFYGEEDFLKRFYGEKLKDALVDKEDTINLNFWKGSDVDVNELIGQAMTMPFFAEHRLILLENTGLFKKGGDSLADFLPDMPEETVLVFCETEVDRRSRLYRQVQKRGVVHECKRQNEETLSNWILRKVHREGKQIQRSAMRLLLDLTCHDLNIIETETEKLLCYTADRPEIMLEDVRAVITVQAEHRVFDLANAIASSQAEKALQLYHDLLFEKQTPIGILAMLSRHYQQLLMVKEFREQGYDVNTISEKTGLQGFAVRKNLGQVSGCTAAELEDDLRRMAETDEAMKSGRMGDKEAAVELLLLELLCRQKARRS